MFFDASIVITSLYGMQSKADPKREKKVKAAIEYLGDKYLLAKPVEKVK